MKNANSDCTVLDVLLENGRDIWDSLDVFKSLIQHLGDNAEIISDALHCYLNSGDFGCPEDAANAVMWCWYLDSMGYNFLKPEHDVLRNGVASFVLQELAYPKTSSNDVSGAGSSFEEVSGNA